MKIERKKLRKKCKLRIKYIELTCSHSQTLTENLLRQSTVSGSNDLLARQERLSEVTSLYASHQCVLLREAGLNSQNSTCLCLQVCHHTWLFSPKL